MSEPDPLEALLDELNKRIEMVEAELVSARCIVPVGVRLDLDKEFPVLWWRGARLWVVLEDADRVLLRDASIPVRTELARLLPRLLTRALERREQVLTELPQILASIDEALA